MNKTSLGFYLPFIFFTILAYLFQTTMPLSPDVAYLLHATNQMLAGGSYATDFFETNPPLILYLYTPVSVFVKLTAIDFTLVFRLYAFLLIFISLRLSFYLINKLMSPNNKKLEASRRMPGSILIYIYTLYFALIFVLLFLPLFEFGQREHLLTIFMLPYLFSTVLLIEDIKLSLSLRIMIASLAALGFGLKPFFLVPLCLIEFYFLLKKKHIRIEPFVIASLMILYLGSTIFFQPSYIQIILPIVMHFYFDGAKQSWMQFFSTPILKFCLLGMITYFLYYKLDQYKVLSTVLFLALVGMIIAFIIPRTAWYSHVLPAASLAYLLVANAYGQVLSLLNTKASSPPPLLKTCRGRPSPAKNAGGEGRVVAIRDYFMMGIISLFIFIIPTYETYHYFNFAVKELWAGSVKELINFFNQQEGERSILCLTPRGTGGCFPLVYMSNSKYASRFPFFWWYYGLRKKENQLTKEMYQEKQFLIDCVIKDLLHFRPRWIILRDKELPVYFSENNKKFQEIWKSYHYSATIEGSQIYTLGAKK